MQIATDVTAHVFNPPALASFWRALTEKRFFKLICGGSLTEIDKIVELVRAFALAGADCIDIAPDAALLEAVVTVLKSVPAPAPVLMVSVPLDLDPHFQKIALDAPACIDCGLCLPECPTEAITLPDVLSISQSLCYGCGRCVPVCPTEALRLLPVHVEAQLANVLANSAVQALEIHSRYADPYMLRAFGEQWADVLQNKVISICFHPEALSDTQVLAFIQAGLALWGKRLFLQIDGAPMSGTPDPEASLPALKSARRVQALLQAAGLPLPAITVSGGINSHTAALMRDPRNDCVAGVGMGTVARQRIWRLVGEVAITEARALMTPFRDRHEDGLGAIASICDGRLDGES